MSFENGKYNLIRNSKWLQGPLPTPEFFTVKGPVTFDQLKIKGYRTMSLTLSAKETATITYIPLIPINQENCLEMGMEMRAVDPGQITYTAEFLDSGRNVVEAKPMNVTSKVEFYFDKVAGQFLVPQGARFVRLFIHFQGPVTACTLWAPYAFYL